MEFVFWEFKNRRLNLEILYTFVGATAVLAVSPGPDNIFVMLQSIAHGRKYGMATVSGLISGCLVHTTLLAFGVSALIKQNDHIFFIIKLFGAGYLFYLAYKVFKGSDTVDLSETGIPKKSIGYLFKQGFIMNVLNPKVTIFFLAFFPGFLFSDNLSLAVQFYVLGALFMGVSFLIFSGLALLSGTISELIKKNGRIGVFLKWMQIVVFISIAIYVLLSEK